MSLVDKQSDFAQCVGLLLAFIRQRGWKVTFGDAYRDPRVPYGHPKSCHRARLAIDLNLFVGGVYQTQTSPEYQVLGDFWESLDSRARWGGRGKLHRSGLSNDPNHFSFEHEGVQ
jgi:hypothetical protein